MHNRLNNQSTILSLSLSLGVLISASAARAEPQETNPSAIHETSSPAEEEAAQVPSELTTRTLTLPDGEPMRPDTSEARRQLPNRPLAVTSATLFATGYLPAFVVAMANSKETSGALYAPVVGPWIEISKNTSPGNRALLTFSGLLQGAGLVGAITSFFVPESRTENWPLLGKRRVSVSPTASKGTYQLAAQGTF